MTRITTFALATILTLGSTCSAAHAGVTDIEQLGSGGLCNTSEQTGGMVKLGDNMAVGNATANKNCDSVLGMINKLRNKEINSEERINNRLINSQNTIGMINSIGSLAAPLLSGLFARSQAPAEAAPQAPDSSQYLQIIQQQQQQIDQLRQLIAQSQATTSGYPSSQAPVQTSYMTPPTARSSNTGSPALRQVSLF